MRAVLDNLIDKNFDILSEYLQFLIAQTNTESVNTPILLSDQNQETDDKEKVVELVFEKL